MNTDIRILDLEVHFRYKKHRSTLKFGGAVKGPPPRSGADLHVSVLVETRDGRRGEGHAGMVLGSSWSWPSQAVSSAMVAESMRVLALRFGGELYRRTAVAHPIEHAMETEPLLLELADEVVGQLKLEEPMPRMCALVAGAPFDAALHDAFGIACGIDSYAGLGPDHMEFDLGRYLGPSFRGRYPSHYLKPGYDATIPVFHLVGGLDKLTRGELTPEDPDDGYPSTLEDWIARDGVYCHKTKLRGNDMEWDLDRSLAVERVAREALSRLGIERLYLTADANEMCPDVEYVVEYLTKVRERSPSAFEAIIYLEQPTTRDLFSKPVNLRPASRLKPVLLDEGLSGLEAMDEALRQGYSGVALKTCKGQTNSLLMLAKAAEAGIPYAVQDLTLSGIALIQSAGFAARIRTIKGFEANGRQFCPAASAREERVHPGLFRARDGEFDLRSIRGPGLGYRYEEWGLRM
jgi:L-alanine-DL-glutamate epimerase-like enolase superfamily enzyme